MKRNSIIEARDLVAIEIKLIPVWLLQSLCVSLWKMTAIIDSSCNNGMRSLSYISRSKGVTGFMKVSAQVKKNWKKFIGTGHFSPFQLFNVLLRFHFRWWFRGTSKGFTVGRRQSNYISARPAKLFSQRLNLCCLL